jgi:hypothetical protein
MTLHLGKDGTSPSRRMWGIEMVDRRHGALLALVALIVIGCAPAPSPTPSEAAQATQQPIPSPSDVPTPCALAVIKGTLVRGDQSALGLASLVGDHEVFVVDWPPGYSVRDDGGRLTLLDAAGQTIAHEGDTIAASGGSEGDGVVSVCEGTIVLAPGPTGAPTPGPVALQTQAPSDVCAMARVGGVLIADPTYGLAFGGDLPFVMGVIWPYGYSARRGDDGVVALIDPDGQVLAREGDRIEAAGAYGNEYVEYPQCDLRVVPN